MKKIHFFLFMLVISFLLMSCGDSSSTSPTTTSVTTTTSTAPTTTSTSTTSTTTVTYPVTIRETGEGFDTIGEAITAATAGQHIDVSAGTYTENLVLDKQLYLVGADRTTTIIDGGGGNIVVGLTGSATQGSDISGFTIRNGNDTGIMCEYTTLTVSVCLVEGNSNNGIMYHESSGSIQNTVVENNSVYGIHLLNAAPTVNNCTVQGNGLVGIECGGAPSTPSIAGCTMTNNLIGVRGNDANPDVGGGAGASPGNNTIKGNTSGWDLYNATVNKIKAENNYWDHTTPAAIDAKDIYDDDENSSYGAVDFEPTGSSSASLRMKPRLLSASSLFKDFLHSLFRTDLPVSAVYTSPSLEGKLHIARFDLIEANYRPLTAERYYPPLMLRAGR